MRVAVGFHIDPTDTSSENGRKQTSLPRTVAFYRSLLAQPMPVGAETWFHDHAQAQLRDATVIAGVARRVPSTSTMN